MSGHHHYHHHRRSSNHRSISGLAPSTSYPGLQSYADLPTEADYSSSFSPYTATEQSSMSSFGEIQASSAGYPAPVSSGTSDSSGSSSGGLASLLGGLNLSSVDIKGMIEKMGGIDGLVANVGKFQKVIQGFQQLAPMMSLFTGLLGKKGSGASAASNSDSDHSHGNRPKRRSSGSQGKRRNSSSRPSSGGRKRRRA
ncbi:hypothetical protein [Paenibacillus dakarensis]|uniref:hypothetical protein n=1 Tax=Paenibacillus dakarensis TaxID=1527293 RepID=UPI0006D545A5|nr:hypothetical protein [Paenibacillus dakarensis]